MEWNGNYSDAFDYTEMCTPATSLTLPHGFRDTCAEANDFYYLFMTCNQKANNKILNC